MELFNPDKPNYSRNRWDGYMSGHWQGSEGINPRNIRGIQRYYSDYPWENRGTSVQGDTQGKSRRTSLRDRDSDRDRMPRSMEQDRRQHARGKASFSQEWPEDSGRERRFDRGPGQDRYFESTTRHAISRV